MCPEGKLPARSGSPMTCSASAPSAASGRSTGSVALMPCTNSVAGSAAHNAAASQRGAAYSAQATTASANWVSPRCVSSSQAVSGSGWASACPAWNQATLTPAEAT